MQSMAARLSLLTGVMLLAVPSAVYLWRNSDVPEFGNRHDDSIYYVSAKSLSEGHYRIESLPGKPAQTKYPPLYPLILSIAWRVNPRFPENLPIAAWLSWLALPLMLVQLATYYPRMDISGWKMWLLLVALALNPYSILFSAILLSELWFTALLISALFLVERAVEPDAAFGWPIAAGLVSGLAYLTRSAGIVLLASGISYFFLKRQRRKAWFFTAAMFPFIACWMLWSHIHQVPTTDPAMVYYTNYLRGELDDISLSNIHLVLWKNLDEVLWSLGSMVLPKITDSRFLKILAQVMAVAMISGVVRMVKRGKGVHYTIFSIGSVLLLLIWHYPPDERFVLPLVPLALAGLLTEMTHFIGILRVSFHHQERSQRIAAGAIAFTGILLALGAVGLQAFVDSRFLEQTARQERAHQADLRSAYKWMRSHLPSGATVVSFSDPELFLYTGHTAIGRLFPAKLWYSDDSMAIRALYQQLPAYARAHNATYFYYTTEDLPRVMEEADAKAIEQAIRSNPEFSPIYEQGIGTLYRVRAE